MEVLKSIYVNEMTIENRQLLKLVSKICLVIILFHFHLKVNAQLAIKFDSSTSELYIYETSMFNKKSLDTIPFLKSNYYTFQLKDRKLFSCTYVDGYIDPFYILDSWSINDNGKTVHLSVYFVKLEHYHPFKERKLKMTLNESGIRMCFENGSVREVVLSYSNLENESKLTSSLKRLSKMLNNLQ